MAYPAPPEVTDTDFTTNATSYAANLPATINAGDRLLAFMCTYGSIGSNWGAAPAGWSQLGTSNDYTHVYEYINHPGGGGGTVTFTHAGSSTRAIVRIVRIPGARGDTACSISTFGTGSTATPDPPNLDPAVTRDWLWIAFAQWSHAFGTDRARTAVPTNYTPTTDHDIQPSNGELEVSLAYRQLTASSENPGTFTLNGAAQTWRTVTIAVPPAPLQVFMANYRFRRL